jgi:hypothetical protein
MLHNFSSTLKVVEVLIWMCCLPPLEDLKKTLTMEKLLQKIQQSTSHRRDITKSAIKVTLELIEKHII